MKTVYADGSVQEVTPIARLALGAAIWAAEGLTTIQRAVLAYFYFVGADSAPVTASMSAIARVACCSSDHARRHVHALRRLGWLAAIEAPGVSTAYTLQKPIANDREAA